MVTQNSDLEKENLILKEQVKKLSAEKRALEQEKYNVLKRNKYFAQENHDLDLIIGQKEYRIHQLQQIMRELKNSKLWKFFLALLFV